MMNLTTGTSDGLLGRRSALNLTALVLALLAATASSARAGNTFEREWQAASSATSIADAGYAPKLQAYFDTHRGYRDCDAQLPDGSDARMLLRFDANGVFRTVGEAANSAVESCLAKFFAANPPPRPARLPLDLPFRLQ